MIALNNLLAVFKSGYFNVIVGYSGCGKTTLLKCIVSLIGDYDGTIYIDNIDVFETIIQEKIPCCSHP